MDVTPTGGAIREPILKVMHVLRSLEYESRDGREVELDNLISKIGQAPFDTPSVFGFYLADYSPKGPVSAAGQTAPEAELATPPNVIGLLNGLHSLIDHGLTSCDAGFGSTAVRRKCGQDSEVPPDGELSWTPSNDDDAIDELDLLLTGGRLPSETRAILETQLTCRDRCENWCAGHASSWPQKCAWTTRACAACAECESTCEDWKTGGGLKAAQKLLVASSSFQTASQSAPTGEKREPPAPVESRGRPYKAIVVLMMRGAANSYNFIVPKDGCEWLAQEYGQVRGAAALENVDDLEVIETTGQPCTGFAVHDSLQYVRALYENQEAVFVANVGTLVEPVTREEFQAKSKRLPPSLFAHNICQRSALNVHAQDKNAEGLFGRAIRAMTKGIDAWKTNAYSIAGRTKLFEGDAEAFMVNRKSGVERLRSYQALKDEGFEELAGEVDANVFADEHAKTLQAAIQATENIGPLIDGAAVTQDFGTSVIGQQLEKVAKIISLRDQLDVERDVFFVEVNGFDDHNNMHESLAGKLSGIDVALKAFTAEIGETWQDTTFVTISDFGRTLTSNGLGTDHAWGGNMIIAGGGIDGGRILGHYPTDLSDDGYLSIGRGRLIPTTSWEQMWKGVLLWFGVEESQLDDVLPNLENFPASNVDTLYDASLVY